MKEILYSSTRGGEKGLTASQAILKGLAGDGGLFMPDVIPVFDFDPETLVGKPYQEVAWQVMKLLLTDYTEEELRYCIEHAYDEKFDTEEIAPLVRADGAYYLELFHGKTIAFKDMALSILPYLMTTAAKKNGVTNKIEILTATSGDTGKAAMAGFADVPGTGIIVFYPKGGVSRFQELQMITQKGDNTGVVSIHGNFDDAQTGVKKIFGDKAFAERLAENGIQLSSANSINIGRLVPQIVYYVWAWLKLRENGEIAEKEAVNFCVPTGNFGNILAAYFAKKMGLPVKKLICASNDNKVLYDFFTTGTYDRNREFILTTSPSMDILISSNLERLIYLSAGEDAASDRVLMRMLASGGKYSITREMKKNIADFTGGSADPLYRRAIRVSMGSVFQIPWTVADSADDLFSILRASGFVTAALSLRDDSICIDHPIIKEAAALALYLGNEGNGLPARRIASCDYSVKIPMYHGVDSLNVAAASAVAFWECRKQIQDRGHIRV